jgi:hypothetical protein
MRDTVARKRQCGLATAVFALHVVPLLDNSTNRNEFCVQVGRTWCVYNTCKCERAPRFQYVCGQPRFNLREMRTWAVEWAMALPT